MAFHPLCGFSLQRGTKIISILQIIGAVIIITVAILLILEGAFDTVDAANNPDEDFANRKLPSSESNNSLGYDPHDEIYTNHKYRGAGWIIFGIFFSIIGICTLISGIILLMGTKARNLRKCRIWLVIQTFVVAILIFSFVVGFFTCFGLDIGIYYIPSPMIIPDLYFIWIVWAFVEELKVESSDGEEDEISPIALNIS